MSGITIVPLSQLSATFRSLAVRAIEASAFAYTPYSTFFVGAALLHPDGSVTVGANWENCIYQAICGERAAIVTANSCGKRTAVAIAVYGVSGKPEVKPAADKFTTPCGVCRQCLHEVGQLSSCDLDVIMVTQDKANAAVAKLSTILPEAFGPKDVLVDVSKWAEGPKGKSSP